MFPSVQERGVGKVALVLKVCLGVNYFIRRWHTVAALNRATRQLQFRRALDGKKSSKDSKKGDLPPNQSCQMQHVQRLGQAASFLLASPIPF